MSNSQNMRKNLPPHRSMVQTVYPVHQGILSNVGTQDETKNTYIVIVNKGDARGTEPSLTDPRTSQPCLRLKGLPKVRLKMNDVEDVDYGFGDVHRELSENKRNVGDNVKMNLSDIGFEDYDSTTSALRVFKDESEEMDESEVSRKKRLLSNEAYTCEKGKHTLNIKKEVEDDLFLSPTPGTVNFVNSETPLTKMDLSGSSGYNSACSPFFQSTFDTPSAFPSTHLTQSAARQIFLISPNQQGNDASGGGATTPISFISTGLKNVAMLQSPSEVLPPQTHSSTLQSTPLCGSSVQTVAINPSFLTSTPITQTLTSSHTEALSSVKPFNVKLPILHPGQVPNNSSSISSSDIRDTAVIDKEEQRDKLRRDKVTSKKNQSVQSKAEKIGNVILHFDVKPSEACVSVENVQQDDYVISSSQETVPSSSQDTFPGSSQESMDSQEIAVSEKESLDDSLTNMQWLGGIKLKKDEQREVASGKSKEKEGNNNPLQWRYLSPSDIKRIAQECGKTKRPPFSYMSLIQMALNSTEEKKMTLREICKWIDSTFPFYKHTAKPGWKNSIRHNLSLYSIFEREKSKKHGSYWTMRDDCPEKTKVIPANKDKKDSGIAAHLASMIPFMPTSVFPQSHTSLKLPLPPAGSLQAIPFPHSTGAPTVPVARDSSHRKGPQPILPRPCMFETALRAIPLKHTPTPRTAKYRTSMHGGCSQKITSIPHGPQPILPRPCMFGAAPMQTYALIPIQGVGQSMQLSNAQNQPMIVQVSSEQGSQTGASCKDSKQENDQADAQARKKKMITIAPKAIPAPSGDTSVNIVRQAWLDAQNLTSDSETERASNRIACKIEDRFETESTYENSSIKKGNKRKESLPKPKFFARKTPPSKKTRSRRKQKLIPKERSLMQDSSDDESDFVTNLEKQLPTPIRNILDKNEVEPEKMTTSTPFKAMCFSSPQLPSPIRGFTPLKNSLLVDGMILDCFKDSDTDGKGFVISPDILSSKKKSPSILRTPGSPHLDLNFTPIKSLSMIQDTSNNGHSLSKFIAEFPIDSQFMEEGDGLPADLSNLNWSVGQADNDT